MPFSIPWNTQSLNIVIKQPMVLINNYLIILGRSTTGNTIASTNTLTSWTGNNTIGTSGRAAAFNGTTTYFAVGEGTSTMVSSIDNGTTWSVVTSPFSTAGYDIIYAGSQFVACGTGTNALAYYNGTSWIPVNTGLTSGTQLFYDASATRLYVMGQGANTVSFATSASSTWTGLGTYIFPTGANTMNGTYNPAGGREWVAAGQGTNSLAYSADICGGTILGAGVTIYSSAANDVAHGIAQDGTLLWVSVGGTNHTIAYSTNVQNSSSWVGLGKTLITNTGYGVAFGTDCSGNPIWMAGGNGTSKLIYSRNPTGGTAAWITVSQTALTNIVVRLTYGRDSNGTPLWMACGSGTNFFAYSKNPTVAASWTGISSLNSLFATQGNQIKYGTDCSGNPLWIGVAFKGTTGNRLSIAYSRTPTVSSSWTGVGNDVSFNIALALEYGTDCSGNPLWMAGGTGNGNTIAYSRNPTVSSAWIGLGTSIFNVQCSGLFYGVNAAGKPIWTAAGSATNKMAYSYNPTVASSWVQIAGTFSTICSLVGQSKVPKFIMGGIGVDNMSGSIDGQTWYYIPTPFSIATNDVYWNQAQQLWVAVGEGGNTIAYSNNGLAWTGIGTSVFLARGNKVRYGTQTSKWYAAGEGTNTLAASIDGKSWSPITSIAGYVDISGLGLFAL